MMATSVCMRRTLCRRPQRTPRSALQLAQALLAAAVFASVLTTSSAGTAVLTPPADARSHDLRATRLPCFLTIGDWGRRESLVAQLQEPVAAGMGIAADDCRTRFPGTEPAVVTVGDNFYGAITEVDSPRFDALWTDVYNAVPSLDGLPWLFSLGNHDIDDNPGKELILAERAQLEPQWFLPSNYYDVRYTVEPGVELHLVIVDTNVWDATQADWLERTLAFSTAHHLHVVGHHPVVSAGYHGNVMEDTRLHELLERYDVAAYHCGHDHNLQHLELRGIDYLISGAGGKLRDDNIGSPYSKFLWGTKGLPGGTWQCSLDDAAATCRAVNASGQTLHTVTAPGRPARANVLPRLLSPPPLPTPPADPQPCLLDAAPLVLPAADAQAHGAWPSTTAAGTAITHRTDDHADKGHKALVFALPIDASGLYEVRLEFVRAPGHTAEAKVTVRHHLGTSHVLVDQRSTAPASASSTLGVFRFDGPGEVVVDNRWTEDGAVSVVAVSVTCVQPYPTPTPTPGPTASPTTTPSPFQELPGEGFCTLQLHAEDVPSPAACEALCLDRPSCTGYMIVDGSACMLAEDELCCSTAVPFSGVRSFARRSRCGPDAVPSPTAAPTLAPTLAPTPMPTARPTLPPTSPVSSGGAFARLPEEGFCTSLLLPALATGEAACRALCEADPACQGFMVLGSASDACFFANAPCCGVTIALPGTSVFGRRSTCGWAEASPTAAPTASPTPAPTAAPTALATAPDTFDMVPTDGLCALASLTPAPVIGADACAAACRAKFATCQGFIVLSSGLCLLADGVECCSVILPSPGTKSYGRRSVCNPDDEFQLSPTAAPTSIAATSPPSPTTTSGGAGGGCDSGLVGTELELDADASAAGVAFTGSWYAGSCRDPCAGKPFVHERNGQNGPAAMTFSPPLTPGWWRVLLSYQASASRSTQTPVEVRHADGPTVLHIDQKQPPPLTDARGVRFVELGTFWFDGDASAPPAVHISNSGADGKVVVDSLKFQHAGCESSGSSGPTPGL